MGMSVSTLMSLLVRRFVYVDIYLEDNPWIIVSSNTLSEFLKNLSDEQAAEMGEELGRLFPVDYFFQQGLRRELGHVIFFISEWLDRYGV